MFLVIHREHADRGRRFRCGGRAGLCRPARSSAPMGGSEGGNVSFPLRRNAPVGGEAFVVGERDHRRGHAGQCAFVGAGHRGSLHERRGGDARRDVGEADGRQRCRAPDHEVGRARTACADRPRSRRHLTASSTPRPSTRRRRRRPGGARGRTGWRPPGLVQIVDEHAPAVDAERRPSRLARTSGRSANCAANCWSTASANASCGVSTTAESVPCSASISRSAAKR